MVCNQTMFTQYKLEKTTPGRGVYDLTDEIQAFVQQSHAHIGLCHVFLMHTSASLILCENADKQVQIDLDQFMTKLVPDANPLFQHNDEGPDDMPSHVKTILTTSFLSLP